MATCRFGDGFESKGKKTPEYAAFRSVSQLMKQDIEGEIYDIMEALLAAQVIPCLEVDPGNTITSVILSEVARDPVLFYALQCVLEKNNINNRYKNVLKQLRDVFNGKYILSMNYLIGI